MLGVDTAIDDGDLDALAGRDAMEVGKIPDASGGLRPIERIVVRGGSGLRL